MLDGKASRKLQQAQITAQAPPIKLPKTLPGDPVGAILNVNPVETARQITLLDWQIFSLLKVSKTTCFLNFAYL